MCVFVRALGILPGLGETMAVDDGDGNSMHQVWSQEQHHMAEQLAASLTPRRGMARGRLYTCGGWSMASTIHLYTTTTIYRDVDASQEVRLFTAQESARITNIRWRGASAKRDGRHEHLLVLRLAKEEVGQSSA